MEIGTMERPGHAPEPQCTYLRALQRSAMRESSHLERTDSTPGFDGSYRADAAAIELRDEWRFSMSSAQMRIE
jgi:hypothetical protein